MNNAIRKLALFCVFVCFSCIYALCQSPLTDLQQDFPKLSARYASNLGNQKAHYIFVVDVSSSMQAYEQVEKTNLLRFVDSVPNGDQITIIRMASKDWTNYVDLFKCIALDEQVRQALRTAVNSPSFRFLRTGDPQDGSDGFKTASLIVDAINTVGSNDLTFIYLFTDFEYWTHQYRFDKNREPWASLEDKIPSNYRSGMCKFGIELATNQQPRPEAIFKPEMDRIFGKVSYLPISSAAVLSQWFSHISADVMAAKMNAALKEEWEALMNNIVISDKIEGNELKAMVTLDSLPASPLITEVTVELDNPSHSLTKTEPLKLGLGQEGTIGHFVIEKGLLPKWIKIGNPDSCLNVTFHSEYDEEIDRLRKKCKEDPNFVDAVSLQRQFPLSKKSSRVWGSIIPIWGWIIAGLILLIVIASFIYQYLVMKTNHRWTVSVKEDGLKVKCPAPDFTVPFVVGKAGNYPVPNADWTLTVLAKRYNPLLFWKKSGYYLNWVGGPATVKDQLKKPIQGLPSDERLCPLKESCPYTIERGVFSITLSCF